MLSRASLALFVGVTLLAADASARRTKPKRKPTPPAVAAPIEPPPAPPPDLPATQAKALALPSDKLLMATRRAYESLEYGAVVPLGQELLRRTDLTPEARREACALLGASLVIVERIADAELTFRLLLGEDPAYELPADTSPKVLAVFRRVQLEEERSAEHASIVERGRMAGAIDIELQHDQAPVGGRPFTFAFLVKDPHEAVATARVSYRRTADPGFVPLALERDGELWAAELDGEITENQGGLTLEYFVTTFDEDGEPLASEGGLVTPLSVSFKPGTVAQATPIYRKQWFWIASAATLVGLGIGGFILLDTDLPQHDLGPYRYRGP